MDDEHEKASFASDAEQQGILTHTIRLRLYYIVLSICIFAIAINDTV